MAALTVSLPSFAPHCFDWLTVKARTQPGRRTQRRRGNRFQFSSRLEAALAWRRFSIAAVQALVPSAFAMSPKVAFSASLTCTPPIPRKPPSFEAAASANAAP